MVMVPSVDQSDWLLVRLLKLWQLAQWCPYLLLWVPKLAELQKAKHLSRYFINVFCYIQVSVSEEWQDESNNEVSSLTATFIEKHLLTSEEVMSKFTTIKVRKQQSCVIYPTLADFHIFCLFKTLRYSTIEPHTLNFTYKWAVFRH